MYPIQKTLNMFSLATTKPHTCLVFLSCYISFMCMLIFTFCLTSLLI